MYWLAEAPEGGGVGGREEGPSTHLEGQGSHGLINQEAAAGPVWLDFDHLEQRQVIGRCCCIQGRITSVQTVDERQTPRVVGQLHCYDVSSGQNPANLP